MGFYFSGRRDDGRDPGNDGDGMRQRVVVEGRKVPRLRDLMNRDRVLTEIAEREWRAGGVTPRWSRAIAARRKVNERMGSIVAVWGE